MSRCFPYQPKGRADVIKIQKEKDKFLSGNHKAKKESKETKKHRKENNGGTRYIGSKFFKEEKSFFRKESGEEAEKSGLTEEHNQPVSIRNVCFFRKESGEEAEKSGLTEEHNQPVSIHNVCYLSDDGIQSNKRKLDHPATEEDKPRNILRIRLPLRRPKEPDVSCNGQGLCSTSGRADSVLVQSDIVCVPNQEQDPSVHLKVGTIAGNFASTLENTFFTSALGTKESSVRHEGQTSSRFRLCVSEKQKAGSLYKQLIEDWVPPPLQFHLDGLNDQDWLFGTSKRETQGSKRLKTSQDVSCCGSSSLWPQVQYLPEADVYALPYTIPF